MIAANDAAKQTLPGGIQLVTPAFTNSGRLIAGRGIEVAALGLTNQGTIQSTRSDSVTRLSTVGDLANEGGSIAGGQIDLTAGGNLINRADSFARTTDLPGGTLTETVTGAAGRIVAVGDASLAAGNTLTVSIRFPCVQPTTVSRCVTALPPCGS